MRNLVKSLFAVATTAAALVGAATPAQAQLFYSDTAYERGTVEPGDALIGIALPGANAAELRAGLVWNLRAGMNVGALRCQAYRYLRTVDVYNGVLAHHSAELANAYSTLEGYFRRRASGNARNGQRAFDNWNTSTYQDYSTQNAIGFCQTVGNIGKDVLSRPKGELFAAARERIRELRSSAALRHVDRIAPPTTNLRPLPATLFAGPVCTGLTGRALQQCQAGQTPAR